MTTIQATEAANFVQTAIDNIIKMNGSGPEALLPEPSPLALGSDAFTALAALITQADQQDSAAARKQQDEADTAAIVQDNARVAQMMDKASQDESQGLATGLGDIAGGVATAVGGCLPDGTGSATKTSYRAIADGIGKAMPGVGTIVASSYKSQADRDDAQAASDEAAAQVALRRYDAAHSAEQSADASVQKVAQFLETLIQTADGSRSAAASMLKG
jgi:hypothetical protein